MTFVMAKTKDTQQVTVSLHEQQPCQSVRGKHTTLEMTFVMAKTKDSNKLQVACMSSNLANQFGVNTPHKR